MRTVDRLGCGVSYTQIAEIYTALCLQKREESETGVALPRNIYQGVLITLLAWDSIDPSEETTSGEGTSHRVNGMAVQSSIIGPIPQSPQRNMKWTQTNRSRMPGQ